MAAAAVSGDAGASLGLLEDLRIWHRSLRSSAQRQDGYRPVSVRDLDDGEADLCAVNGSCVTPKASANGWEEDVERQSPGAARYGREHSFGVTAKVVDIGAGDRDGWHGGRGSPVRATHRRMDTMEVRQNLNSTGNSGLSTQQLAELLQSSKLDYASLLASLPLRLERDCYSSAAVREVPLWLAATLPPASAAVQFLVLYFLAFDNANLYAEGHWLEPLSVHTSVNTTKLLSSIIALFKVSTEFGHAQRLCHLLVHGGVEGLPRRICCWWALTLQYTMALTVLSVALSLILAGQNCASCLLKTLSVWLVIDVDNFAANLVGMWLDVDLTAVSSRAVMDWSTKGSRWARFIFTIMPVMLIVVEGSVAFWTNTLPLTLVQHGYVSNRGAPQMLEHVLPVVADGLTSHTKYSVLLLAPRGEPPPRLFWVGLNGSPEPQTPNSYQVAGGLDSYSNVALCAGSVVSEPVQAHYWLQEHGFSNKLYQDLTKSKQLYHSTMPYQASFELQELPPELFSYKVFATAQNSATQALSPTVVAAETVFTSACGPNCRQCDEAGSGYCEMCEIWAHRTEDGRCLPCPKQCQQCHLSESRCDAGSCVPGYGLTKEGECVPCGVENCHACDKRLGYFNGTCDSCESGYGLGPPGRCHRCAHPHCICEKEGECKSCMVGWGLVKNETDIWCRACAKGCLDCDFAGTHSCIGCTQGFVERGGECHACAENCMNCKVDGPGRCDVCMKGYGQGAMKSTCSKCQVQHCEVCDKDIWQCEKCKHGLGVTPDGQCEPCGEMCDQCDQSGLCKECRVGYALAPEKVDEGGKDGQCWSCADQCESCREAGPAMCDRCRPGYRLDAGSKTCLPDRLGLGHRAHEI